MTATVLLSIRPRFAELILNGTKTVELRRSLVKASAGDRMLLYVSSPRSSVVGYFDVQAVESGTPQKLWMLVRDKCGLSRKEFNDYYVEAKSAVAIFLSNPKLLKKPIPLSELRRRFSG